MQDHGSEAGSHSLFFVWLLTEAKSKPVLPLLCTLHQAAGFT
jgi:hypothetical protein